MTTNIGTPSPVIEVGHLRVKIKVGRFLNSAVEVKKRQERGQTLLCQGEKDAPIFLVPRLVFVNG